MRLERAELMYEVLQAKLAQKDEYISMLKEQIHILKASPSPPIVETPTASPVKSASPSVEVPATPEKPSYAATTTAPYFILRGPPKLVKVPDCRGRLKAKHNLSIVYLLGLHQKKVGEFRKQAKSTGLSLQHVQNISFVGKSIVELLIESSSQQDFVNQAKSLGYNIRVDLSVTNKSKDNPVWIEYGHEDSSLSEVIKSNFIRRISHEIKSVTNDRVRQYYIDWVDELGWKDSLLVTSTPSSP
jgi:hypothetical protein